jgi:hypothetical protein
VAITQMSQKAASPSHFHYNSLWPDQNRKPSNRSHTVERVMRHRAKDPHRWHSARSCSQEHHYQRCCRWRKRSTAATASAGVGSSPFRLRLFHHPHPDLPCCVSRGSGNTTHAGATGDAALRQHSRIVLGVPARLTTGGPDSALRCASHIPAPHRWHNATAAREVHSVSTRQR